MAITLAQAKELSQDKLTGEIIDEFMESPLLADMIFDNTVKPSGGKSLTYVYNKVDVQPTAAARKINNEYTAQEASTKQEVANLRPLGGSYEVDRVIQNDETQLVDHIQFQTNQKAKATVALAHDLFVNGVYNVTDDTGFDGIDVAIKGSVNDLDSTADLSSAEAIKTGWGTFLFDLRQLVGKVRGATHLLVNNDMWTAFQSLSDHVPNINFTRNEMGDVVGHYGAMKIVELGDKPGTSDPIIGIKDGLTDVYAIRIARDGVHMVSPEGNDLVKHYYPDMTAPGAVKLGEVEIVLSTVVKHTKSAGVLRGIRVIPAGVEGFSLENEDNVPNEGTVAWLKSELDALGVEYDAKATKAELEALLEENKI